MFTGIVQTTGKIVRMEQAGGKRLWVQSRLELKDLSLGASVCHSGVCLTVEESREIEPGLREHVVWASNETLDVTTLSGWEAGQEMNLEPSLRLGDELGGHFVFGHVDALGSVQDIRQDGEGWIFRFAMPPVLEPLVAHKGSVGVDGMSLTAIDVRDGAFSVAIIPQTYEITTLKDRKVGDAINLEADMLARYVSRQLSFLPSKT